MLKYIYRKIAVLLAAAMLFSAGCGQSEQLRDAPAASSEGFTITDSEGREVSFTKPPERMVVLTPAQVETIYFLGEESRLAAISGYANYPEATASLPKVATGSETNIEEIVALSPDCVVMSLMDQKKEDADALEKIGINVVIMNPQTVSEAYDSILLLGEIVGKKEDAERKVADMRAKMDKLSELGKQQAQRTVYFEVSPLEYGLYTTGTNTFLNEIIEMAGAKNLFADLDGWAQVSEEQVIDRNPDVIISTCQQYGIADIKGEIAGRTGWGGIAAVAAGDIYDLDGDLVTRPGPRMVDAAYAVYEAMYGVVE